MRFRFLLIFLSSKHPSSQETERRRKRKNV